MAIVNINCYIKSDNDINEYLVKGILNDSKLLFKLGEVSMELDFNNKCLKRINDGIEYNISFIGKSIEIIYETDKMKQELLNFDFLLEDNVFNIKYEVNGIEVYMDMKYEVIK